MADPVKSLRIKVGMAKRIKKEVAHYRQEAAQLTEKVAKMEADGADGHDIKQQRGVLEESMAMVPDALRRYEEAVEGLRELVAGATAATTASPLFAEAEAIIKEADEGEEEEAAGAGGAAAAAADEEDL